MVRSQWSNDKVFKMHTIIFTYKFKHMRTGAILTVVVLAVVRPPPCRVYLVVFDPAGVGCWQGFFYELVDDLKRNYMINWKRH